MSTAMQIHEPRTDYPALQEPALLRGFDLLATAPQGVAKLRNLIRSLAVRGLLVPQDKNDESAHVLLTNIVTTKNCLIAEGKLRSDKFPTDVSEADRPFVIPPTWTWARFGSVSINRDGERVPVSSEDRQQRAKVFDYYGASGVIDKIDSYLFDKTLLLIGEDGANLINRATPIAFLASGKYWVNNHAHVIDTTHPGLMEYLGLFINAISLDPYITGTAQPKMNQAKMNSIPVALPPLAEQARIVARVEELMQLCDMLEAHGRLQDEQHARLVATLLDALAASESAHALAENWQRIAAHFDLLLDRPEAVDALEQTLLQLAVRGLLAPQDAADEPAGEFLSRIRTEKDRLIARGEIKRDKPASSVSDDEKPFEIRPGWEWAPFGTLVNVSSGITLGRKTTPMEPVTLPYLRVANVQRWHLDLDHLKTITVAEGELPRFLLKPSDLLLTEGGDWDKVGRTCIWKGDIELCLHQNHVFKARGVLSEWSPAWAELYLNSTDARTFFAGASKQTTNLASINSTQLKSCPFPVPPLAEQHRIVARVEQLRRLCANLRDRLQQSRATQTRLAETLVTNAVGQQTCGDRTKA